MNSDKKSQLEINDSLTKDYAGTGQMAISEFVAAYTFTNRFLLRKVWKKISDYFLTEEDNNF